MKKILSVIAVLTLVLLVFCSCGRSEEVKACEDKIKEIGEVSVESEELILAAEEAFMVLSGEDKSKVRNKGELEDARAEYDRLKEIADKADELSEKLDKTFTEYGISKEELASDYEALKGLIPEAEQETNPVLAQVEEKLSELDEKTAESNASAVSYVKGFYEINKDKNVTVKEIGCITQVADGLTYCLFALKYEEDGEEKAVYSKARFSGTPSVESMTSYRENFYGESPASEETDALASGNVIIDTAKVLEDAKA